jgi:hypothetical protein
MDPSTRDLTFAITDMMVVTCGGEESLSFVCLGDPPAQARGRINWRNRPVPVYYDPSSRSKAAYALVLRNALMSFGTSSFPIFNREILASTKGLKLTVAFYLHRKVADYHVVSGKKVLKKTAEMFPKNKDVDNMLKFVMDAIHGVVYDNNTVITSVIAMKTFIPENRREGPAYSEISIQKVN